MSSLAVASLQEMIRQGFEPFWIALILRRQLQPALLHFLNGPILTHRPLPIKPWPEWLPRLVYMDRLERIMVEHATGKIGDRATLVEAMAYLLSATEDKRVTQQWGTGWFHVYGHITYQVLEKHKLHISAQDTQIVHAYGALELTPYEEENLLVPLLKVIRRVVVREGRQAAVSGAASLQAACSSQQYPTFYHVALLMEKELKRGCKVDKKLTPDSSATE